MRLKMPVFTVELLHQPLLDTLTKAETDYRNTVHPAPQKRTTAAELFAQKPVCCHYEWQQNASDSTYTKVECSNQVEGKRGNGFLCKVHQDLLDKKKSVVPSSWIDAEDILKLDAREILRDRTERSHLNLFDPLQQKVYEHQIRIASGFYSK